MRRFVVPLLVPASLVVACADGRERTEASVPDPSGVPTTTTTVAPSSTTSPSPPTDEEAIVAAVLGYWDAVIALNSEAPPGFDELASFATGEAYETSRDQAERRSSLGQAIRLPSPSRYQHSPAVQSIEGDRAQVLDCAIDDSVLVDRASGRVLNDLVETTLWRTSVMRVAGEWLVSETEIVGGAMGAQSCDGLR